MKINTIALTEKGLVKTAVRQALANHVAQNPAEVFKQAQKVADKNAYYVEVTDPMGNIIYINLDVSVSVKPPYERAERKAKAKPAQPTSAIEVE